ncbi:hypothetical protein CCR75_008354 [Bremia lactucae]|uniref:Uncharacterized protein n=1 Tax=Bremia lactucae TaxID=4779 RepID=A0A976FFI1_BRELC|nr:hypothetical protein CCR75_008354 [Bremia lactucae]
MLVRKLKLEVNYGKMMQVNLGYVQVVHRPRRLMEMYLQIPGLPMKYEAFQAMSVPKNKDVILGMMWLREQNPVLTGVPEEFRVASR